MTLLVERMSINHLIVNNRMILQSGRQRHQRVNHGPAQEMSTIDHHYSFFWRRVWLEFVSQCFSFIWSWNSVLSMGSTRIYIAVWTRSPIDEVPSTPYRPNRSNICSSSNNCIELDNYEFMNSINRHRYHVISMATKTSTTVSTPAQHTTMHKE